MSADAHPVELSIAAAFAAHGHIPQLAFGVLVDGAPEQVIPVDARVTASPK